MKFLEQVRVHEELHAPVVSEVDCNHQVYFDGLRQQTSYDWVRGILGEPQDFWEDFRAYALCDDAPGWVFLTLSDDELVIHREPDNLSPLRDAYIKGTPLLALDMWEHAYYLKYHNDVEAYIEDWRQHIDWAQVANAYTHAVVSPKL